MSDRSEERDERMARWNRPVKTRDTTNNNELIEGIKKLQGLPPHNHPGNIVWGDGYFANSLIRKFGQAAFDDACAALSKEPAKLPEVERDFNQMASFWTRSCGWEDKNKEAGWYLPLLEVADYVTKLPAAHAAEKELMQEKFQLLVRENGRLCMELKDAKEQGRREALMDVSLHLTAASVDRDQAPAGCMVVLAGDCDRIMTKELARAVHLDHRLLHGTSNAQPVGLNSVIGNNKCLLHNTVRCPLCYWCAGCGVQLKSPTEPCPRGCTERAL